MNGSLRKTHGANVTRAKRVRHSLLGSSSFFTFTRVAFRRQLDGERRVGLEGDRFLERRDGFVALAQVEEHDAFVAIDDRVVRHAGRDRPGALQLFQRALA